MDNWAPIRYREFWDIPRIFVVRYQGKMFLFDCAFDETAEDFPDYYRVYHLPELGEDEMTGSWDKLHQRATQYVGDVLVGSVQFDRSKRREIDTAVLDELTARIGAG